MFHTKQRREFRNCTPLLFQAAAFILFNPPGAAKVNKGQRPAAAAAAVAFPFQLGKKSLGKKRAGKTACTYTNARARSTAINVKASWIISDRVREKVMNKNFFFFSDFSLTLVG